MYNKIKETLEKVKSSINMDDASLFTKVTILILILLLFHLLFNLGLFILIYINKIEPNPIILNGMVNSYETRIISTNPNISGSKPILRSINEKNGIEYTWSCWFYVDNINPNNSYKIFSKGNNSNMSVSKFHDNSPGLYIINRNNVLSLQYVLNTYDNFNQDNSDPTNPVKQYSNDAVEDSTKRSPYELIEIYDIPIKKWINSILIIKNKKVEIYIQGLLRHVHHLSSIPIQNYYDIYIGESNGFIGKISDLRYFNYAINNMKIQEIWLSNNSNKLINEKTDNNKPPRLALNWYNQN